MKKKTLLILAIMVFASGLTLLQAQNSGSGFAYQAVLRDLQGNVINEKDIKLVFSLYENASESTAKWTQTKNIKTDKFGIVKTIVGKESDDKTPAVGFTAINFASARYWFKVELQMGDEVPREISFAELPSAPYAESAYSVSFTVPVGTIVAFAGTTIPDGWLLCDGKEYKKEGIYFHLSQVLTSNWENSTNSDDRNFKVPDLRGSFLRGLDTAGTTDKEANRKLGTKQDYAVDVKDFKGSINTYSLQETLDADSGVITNGGWNGGTSMVWESTGNSQKKQAKVQKITITPPANYTTETRPVNHAVNYIIKY